MNESRHGCSKRALSLSHATMKQPHQPRIEIIGAASGHGAPDPRCADAPAALRAAGLLPRLRAAGIIATWRATVRPSPAHSRLPLTAVAQVCRDLARHAEAAVARGSLPLVLGGDHSCAIGTWKGIAKATSGPLGLIWIDAHMDAHTPQTTESGRLHGMPLAALLGHGDETLTGIASGARLDPRHVCLIGVRSFEAGEAALLRRLGVRIFPMREVRQRGFDATLREAREIACAGYCGLWDFGRSRCDRSWRSPRRRLASTRRIKREGRRQFARVSCRRHGVARPRDRRIQPASGSRRPNDCSGSGDRRSATRAAARVRIRAALIGCAAAPPLH